MWHKLRPVLLGIVAATLAVVLLAPPAAAASGGSGKLGRAARPAQPDVVVTR